MDYQATLYDPIYLITGVPAVLTVGSNDFALTALDKTRGIDIGIGGGDASLQNVKPGAILRVAELRTNGLTADDLEGATITLNGLQWIVESTKARPSPKGERDGELLLILSGGTEAESESDA